DLQGTQASPRSTLSFPGYGPEAEAHHDEPGQHERCSQEDRWALALAVGSGPEIKIHEAGAQGDQNASPQEFRTVAGCVGEVVKALHSLWSQENSDPAKRTRSAVTMDSASLVGVGPIQSGGDRVRPAAARRRCPKGTARSGPRRGTQGGRATGPAA